MSTTTPTLTHHEQECAARQTPPALWDGWDFPLIAVGFVVTLVVVTIFETIAILYVNGLDWLLRAGLGSIEEVSRGIPAWITNTGVVILSLGMVGTLLLTARLRHKAGVRAVFGVYQPEWAWIALALALPLAGGRAWLGQLMMAWMPHSAAQAEAITSITHVDGLMPLLGSMVVMALLVPLWEELFFRGMLYRWMRGRMGLWPAVLLSAAIFGAFHLNLIQGLLAFLLAVPLALLYERSEYSLWAPLALHIANNAIAATVLTLGVLLLGH